MQPPLIRHARFRRDIGLAGPVFFLSLFFALYLVARGNITDHRWAFWAHIAAGALAVLLLLPFLRPFCVAWLPLTYLVPVIPLFILWDAMMSALRTYTTDELLALARAADPNDSFAWQAEERRVTGPLRGIALVGIPRERLTSEG